MRYTVSVARPLSRGVGDLFEVRPKMNAIGFILVFSRTGLDLTTGAAQAVQTLGQNVSFLLLKLRAGNNASISQ